MIATRRTLALATALVAAGGVYACTDSSTAPADGLHREFGAAVAVGNGHARTYVVTNQQAGGAPVEVGVALDEAALDGLPAPMAMPTPASDDPHAHTDYHEYQLPMPAQNATQYKFVELDWNPAGHEPPGIYDIPHFDFHFYTVTLAERNSIDPTVVGAEQFATKSANLPPAAEQAPFYSSLSAPDAPPVAVPHMGVHWADVRSPELQAVFGHPENARPFLTTFLHGSWDGAFIFDEPMVTRAFILGRKTATTAAARDSVIPLPAAAQYRSAGYNPGAYHITYDAAAKEYHVALIQLARHG